MLKTVLATGSLVFLGALQSHATIIAKWTFETSIPASAGPFAPEVGSGLALGSHAGASVYSSPSGNGSAHSFSSTLWAVGDYYQFSVATTGFKDIMLGWGQTSSTTGPRDFKLAYSVDGGGTFGDFASYIVLANQTVAAGGIGAWNTATEITGYNYSFDLSAVTALDNTASVIFRLIQTTTADATPPGTVATGGTDRVDNFTVSGTEMAVVPEASTWIAGLGLSLGMLGTFVRKYRK